jgi:hypothetical protein
MRHSPHISLLMGKDYHGQNPCINPLAMAELMVRLENKRNRNTEPKPCNPVARFLTILRNLIG